MDPIGLYCLFSHRVRKGERDLCKSTCTVLCGIITWLDLTRGVSANNYRESRTHTSCSHIGRRYNMYNGILPNAFVYLII